MLLSLQSLLASNEYSSQLYGPMIFFSVTFLLSPLYAHRNTQHLRELPSIKSEQNPSQSGNNHLARSPSMDTIEPRIRIDRLQGVPAPCNRRSPKVLFFTSTSKPLRVYHADEDLICHTSETFYEMVQLNRKPIEGDCCICQEELDPDDNHLVFCHEGCGQNFHQECHEQWASARPVRDAPPTCAFCRAEWCPENKKPILLLYSLDHAAVDMYLDWLHTRNVHIPAHYAWGDDALNMALLEATFAAVVLKDADFLYAVTAKYLERFKQDEAAFSPRFLRKLFIKRGMPYFENFVVDLCMLGPVDAVDYVEFGYSHEEEQHCGRFYRMLSQAAMKHLGSAKPSLRAFVKNYTRNEYRVTSLGSNNNGAATTNVQGERSTSGFGNEQAQTRARDNEGLTVYMPH